MKILLCDDDQTLFTPFTDNAQNIGIQLTCRENWNEAQKELEMNWDGYNGIILDYKGKRTSDSKTQDSSHLSLAVGWLREQKSQRRYLPVFLYTGFKDDVQEIYPVDDLIRGIYDKNNAKFNYVLQEFIKEIERTSLYKLKIKYLEVFKVFNIHLLDKSKEEKLIQLLEDNEKSMFSKESFNTIRDIFEAILKKANQIDHYLLPNECINENGKLNLEWSCRYITNEKLDIRMNNQIVKTYDRGSRTFVVEHVSACIWLTKNVSCSLSHDYNQPYTINVFRSCLFALLEFITWFTNYVEKYHSDKI
jgi:hypothetical protein